MITSNKFTKIIVLLSTFLIVLFCHSCRNLEIPDDSIVAFSLREAQRILQSKHPEKDVALQQLGGITRVVGAVIDRHNNDIIVIGKKNSQLPAASLDYLTIALRSRLVHDDLPLVSIDAPSDPNHPKRQKVRFGGEIENTQFGLDFLNADILLKKYSLDLFTQIQQVTSYRKLLLNHEISQLQKKGISVTETQSIAPEELSSFEGKGLASESSTQSRFFFNFRNPYKVRCDRDRTAFCIISLDLMVQRESKGSFKQEMSTGKTMPPDQQFADLFSNNYYVMCERYPVLQRLKLLFDMVALAEGLRGTRNLPNLEYLLHNYPVKKIETPKTYNLVRRCTALSRSDGKTSIVQLSGGIESSVELEFLNAGNISYLKLFVLKSRPHKNALYWQVPLDDWKMPNSEGIPVSVKKTTRKGRPTGFSLNVSQSVVYERPAQGSFTKGTFKGFATALPLKPLKTKGGIEMLMLIDSSSFHKVDSLKKIRDSILH